MLISDKIKELNKIAQDFESALNEVKALQEQEISVSVEKSVIENLAAAKVQLKGDLSAYLDENLNNQITQLNGDLNEKIENNVNEAYEKKLNSAEFETILKTKADEIVPSVVDEYLDNYEVLKTRFQNANSVFVMALINELKTYDEALSLIAAINLREEAIAARKQINKVYHGI